MNGPTDTGATVLPFNAVAESQNRARKALDTIVSSERDALGYMQAARSELDDLLFCLDEALGITQGFTPPSSDEERREIRENAHRAFVDALRMIQAAERCTEALSSAVGPFTDLLRSSVESGR